MTAKITPEGLREKDLATLIARMARALRRNDHGNVLATEAVRYLKREQLLSPLRDEDEPDEDLQDVLASNEALVVTNAQQESKLAAVLEELADYKDAAKAEAKIVDEQRASIKKLEAELARLKAPVDVAGMETVAWHFFCRAPGKAMEYASVDKDDALHWPIDQWKEIKVAPLVPLAALESLAAQLADWKSKCAILAVRVVKYNTQLAEAKAQIAALLVQLEEAKQ